MTKRLLILGGTGEAANLATRAIDEFGANLDVISSLAGRLNKPRPLPGRVRVGGFGGSDGLAHYIGTEKIDLLIDATHPFAATISANAQRACLRAGIPRLILARPPWPTVADGSVIAVADFNAAARAVSGLGRRVFLSFGHRELEAFAGLADLSFVVRVIEVPKAPLPIPAVTLITGRPPFALADEKALLKNQAIDVLVSKDSGGAALPAKITAAVDAGLPIVLVARPPTEPGEQAAGIDAALRWISNRL